MAAIRAKNTKPEMKVRRTAHGLGYRFRLHRRDLPGTPDLVFPARRAVVLVHGCFWHRHPGCRFASVPVSNAALWERKFAGNIDRDRRNLSELEIAGWRTLVLWECQIGDPRLLQEVLLAHLGPPGASRVGHTGSVLPQNAS